MSEEKQVGPYPMTACSWGPPDMQQSSAVSMAGTPPSSAAALPISANLVAMSWRLAATWLSSIAQDA